MPASFCCSCFDLELNFKAVSGVWGGGCYSNTAFIFDWRIKAGFHIIHVNALFRSELLLEVSYLGPCLKTLRHDVAKCDPVSWHFSGHMPPSSFGFKRLDRGTLISPYPFYQSACPTLTPPHLSLFGLALARTSIPPPATSACRLHSPRAHKAC